MKAIVQRELGGPEVLVLEEVEDPVPGDGQVHLAVEVAGVHLIDTRVRAGTGPMGPTVLPMVPGREVAGVVDGIGAGADPSWLGRPVVVHLGMADGGYASAAVADQSALLPVPDGVDLADAVAMVGTGRTALGILEVAEVGADDVALVTAAAGGIGVLLVQAAKRSGASVVGAAGGPAKVELVGSLGADLAVDYSVPDWAARIEERFGPRPFTLGLDGVAGALGRSAFDLVGAGGRFVTYGFASGAPLPVQVGELFGAGVSLVPGIGARVMARPGGIAALSVRALDELAAGRLRPVVHPAFALADAAGAHRAIEARATMGKVVLVP